MALVHPLFAHLHTKVSGSINAIFAPYIRDIERQMQVRVRIIQGELVDQGQAFTHRFPPDVFFIILNPQDLNSDGADSQSRSDISRFLVAHELGHLLCGHHEKHAALQEADRGNRSDPKYQMEMEMMELEADLIACDMLFAVGETIERRIMSEKQYEESVGELSYHPINRIGLWKDVRRTLRSEGFIKPPVPILCQALVNVNGENPISTTSLQFLPKLIHSEYRKLLGCGENKPDGMVCSAFACDDCGKGICSEDGHTDEGNHAPLAYAELR